MLLIISFKVIPVFISATSTVSTFSPTTMVDGNIIAFDLGITVAFVVVIFINIYLGQHVPCALPGTWCFLKAFDM
jgi:uncharacterized membrane protein